MWKFFITNLWLILSVKANAQNAFVGSFEGTYNNDNISLTLKSDGGNKLSGLMQDSQQTYTVDGTANGNSFKGTAVETSLGLTFQVSGILNNGQLPLKMTLNAGGQTITLDVLMIKKGASTNSQTAQPVPPQYAKPKLPTGATLDPQLVGKWTKNDYYNSGFGDNAMNAHFSQSLIFEADGSVSDGGSKAGISGSNYSGSSQGSGQLNSNIFWYNIKNQLYLQAFENGKMQTLHLGRYYIEKGNLLITGTNGQKLLLTKQ